MKKLSRRKELYLVRRSYRLKNRAARSNARMLRQHERRERRKVRDAKKVRRVTVVAPATILATGGPDRLNLMRFLARAQEALENGHEVHLDLSAIEAFHPCGTLIFLSMLDTWSRLHPGRLSGTYPGNERSEQLLQHVDALALLGLENRCDITHENVRFWHFYSGTEMNAGIYQDLTTAVLATIDHPDRVLFGDCLNEAVNNTVNHAYGARTPDTRRPSHKRWWMLSEVRDDVVFVAINDLGVTIPESLRTKTDWANFLRNRRWKDSKLIEQAAISKRTSTLQPHRGKGLPEMLEFSRNLASGGLSISSGFGSYEFDAGTNVGCRRNWICPVPGTLVLWQIPFREERIDE